MLTTDTSVQRPLLCVQTVLLRLELICQVNRINPRESKVDGGAGGLFLTVESPVTRLIESIAHTIHHGVGIVGIWSYIVRRICFCKSEI